jgi:hypothetical protein
MVGDIALILAILAVIVVILALIIAGVLFLFRNHV